MCDYIAANYASLTEEEAFTAVINDQMNLDPPNLPYGYSTQAGTPITTNVIDP
jgi:hypothetical protein